MDLKGATARVAAALLLALLLLTGPASASPLFDRTGDPTRRAAIDGVHRQMATCVAFFLIAAEALPPDAGSGPSRRRLDQAAGVLIEQMLRLRDQGVTRARVEAERQWLMLAVGGSLAGYPHLHRALAEPCAAIAADPQGQLDRRLGDRAPETKPQP